LNDRKRKKSDNSREEIYYEANINNFWMKKEEDILKICIIEYAWWL